MRRGYIANRSLYKILEYSSTLAGLVFLQNTVALDHWLLDNAVHMHASVRLHHDIARSNISMANPVLVQGFEGISNPVSDAAHIIPRKLTGVPWLIIFHQQCWSFARQHTDICYTESIGNPCTLDAFQVLQHLYSTWYKFRPFGAKQNKAL